MSSPRGISSDILGYPQRWWDMVGYPRRALEIQDISSPHILKKISLLDIRGYPVISNRSPNKISQQDILKRYPILIHLSPRLSHYHIHEISYHISKIDIPVISFYILTFSMYILKRSPLFLLEIFHQISNKELQ